MFDNVPLICDSEFSLTLFLKGVFPKEIPISFHILPLWVPEIPPNYIFLISSLSRILLGLYVFLFYHFLSLLLHMLNPLRCQNKYLSSSFLRLSSNFPFTLLASFSAVCMTYFPYVWSSQNHFHYSTETALTKSVINTQRSSPIASSCTCSCGPYIAFHIISWNYHLLCPLGYCIYQNVSSFLTSLFCFLPTSFPLIADFYN